MLIWDFTPCRANPNHCMDPQEPSPEEVQKKEEQVQQIKAAWKGESLYYSSIRYRSYDMYIYYIP